MIDLTDKVAIVTGGASGIGKGIGRVLAGQGALVTVADLNEAGAKAEAEELPPPGDRLGRRRGCDRQGIGSIDGGRRASGIWPDRLPDQQRRSCRRAWLGRAAGA